MRKKVFLPLVLIMSMLLALCPASFASGDAPAYFLYECFEEDLGDPEMVSANYVDIQLTDEGAGGSNGAAYATTKARNYGPGWNITLIPGKKYRASIRIKMDEKISSWSTFRFDFRDKDNSLAQFYTDVSGVHYSEGEWQKIEKEFTFSGKSNNNKFDMSGDVIAQFICYASTDGVSASDLGSYTIDDFIIEPLPDNSPSVAVSNLNAESDPYVGIESVFSYEYSGEKADASIARILAESEDNSEDWITVAVPEIQDGEFSFTPDESLLGKKLKIEVRPMDVDGDAGALAVLELEKPVAKEFDIVVNSMSSDEGEVEASITLATAVSKKNIVIMLCQYSENNAMQKMKVESIELLPLEESQVPEPITISDTLDGDATTARLFIWRGMDALETDMVSYISYNEISINQ